MWPFHRPSDADLRAEEAEAQLREASSLLAIARVVGGTTELVDAFRLVCRELASLTGAETVSVHVLDRSGTELRPMAGYHIPPTMLPVLGTEPLPLNEQGFTATVFEAGRPAWSDDVQHDPRFAYRLFRRFPHRSGLIIPLVLDGAPAGAFYLVWWKEARRFEPAETTVLEKIGQQVGVLLRNVRLRDALDTRAARLATLVRLGQLVSSSLQTDEVLGEIARAAAELMSARVVHVWVVDEAGEKLELKATSDAEISRDFGTRVARMDEGGIGRAVARREMLAFPDVFADGSPVLEPRWWQHHGLSSLLDVPIIHEDKPIDGHGTSRSSVVGVLALHGARPFVLGEDERAVLGGFVTQAAVALHHARSYEVQGRLLVQTRQQQREALALEATAREITSSISGREVFARITERVRELCGADVAYLATREDTGGARVVAVAGARTGAIAKLVLHPDTETGRQVLEHATVVRLGADDSDAATREGLTTQVLIPLIVRDTVEGVLVAGQRQGKEFSASQEAVLNRLALQAAIAIHNLRLYEEQRRRGSRLEALSRVARTIARSLDPASLLPVIAGSLLDLFPDAACRLWVVKGDHLVLGAEAGLDEPTRGVTTLARGEGLVGRVVETREPVVLPDVSAADAVNVEWIRAQRFVSAAILPLIGDQCVGALAVVTRTRREFDDDELQILRAFAEHAAIAVEKADRAAADTRR